MEQRCLRRLGLVLPPNKNGARPEGPAPLFFCPIYLEYQIERGKWDTFTNFVYRMKPMPYTENLMCRVLTSFRREDEIACFGPAARAH